MEPFVQHLRSLKRKGRINRVFLFILFFVLPQIAATVITGHTVRKMWREWKGEGKGIHANKRHVFRVVVVWILAYLWLIIFWGGIIFLVKDLSLK